MSAEDISIIENIVETISVTISQEVTEINLVIEQDAPIALVEMTEQGPSGPPGPVGPAGETGQGLIPGGTKGQRLVKKSNLDFDTEWLSQTQAGDKQLIFQDGDVLNGDDDLRWDKSTQSLIIGKPDVFTNDKISIGGALDDYLQGTISNTEEGTSASADWIATNDKGTDDAHYVDVGINSSIYDDPDFDITKANDAYLLNEGGDLVIAPVTEGKRIILGAGGSKVENIQGFIDEQGVDLVEGKSFRIDGENILDARPSIFYGTGSPPSAAGLADGTLFFKYEE